MGKRPLPDDFREFIACLNDNAVQYLLVGGWAVGLYGNPRLTKDIDFLISADENNLERLQKALRNFGAPGVDTAVLAQPGNVFRMGRPPIQIDIITQADGIDFPRCFANRSITAIGGIEVSTISKDDLITNKKASASPQDIADIQFLTRRP